MQGRERPRRVRKAACALSTASLPTIRLRKKQRGCTRGLSISVLRTQGRFLGCVCGFPLAGFTPLLLVLWREQHPEGHEQVMIDFTTKVKPALPVPLFSEER